VGGSHGAAIEGAGAADYRHASGTSPCKAASSAYPGFDALYERTVERIYAYLRARTSSDEEAADLTQAIYLKALKAWPRRPDAPAALVPWLFRIGRNAATDLYRRRRQTVAWEDLPESLQPVAERAWRIVCCAASRASSCGGCWMAYRRRSASYLVCGSPPG